MTPARPATHAPAASAHATPVPAADGPRPVRLGAEQQIQNLLYHYAELMDDAHVEECAALFDRAVFRLGEHEVSAQQMLEQWRSMLIVHPDGTLRTAHLTTNPLIEFAPDGLTATCRSRFTVVQATETLPLQPICSGRYFDTFAVDESGEWYFTSRAYAMPLVGNTSAHLHG